MPAPEREPLFVERLVVAVAERHKVVEAFPTEPPVGPVVQLVRGVVADGAALRPTAPREAQPERLPMRRVEVLGVGPVPEPREALPEELRLPPGEVGSVGLRGGPGSLDSRAKVILDGGELVTQGSTTEPASGEG